MSESQRKRLTLWTVRNLTEPQRLEVVCRVRLRPDAAPDLAFAGVDAEAVTLQTVEPLDGAVAVAFVGGAVGGHVALNGGPLACGMYPIRPTDRIDVGPDSYWLTADLSPLRTAYDPQQHTPDARCCMTKARLKKGQAIVICPGRTETPCNVIYKADAWDAVIQSNRGMKCPNCGFQPGQPQWHPFIRKPQRDSLNELNYFAPKQSAD